MRLNLGQIKEAGRCFRYFRNIKGWTDHRTKEAKIAERVIQKCYLRVTETGFRPDWRTIVGWVDKQVFVSVDVNHTEQFTKAKSCSEHILSFLSRWYNDNFLDENHAIFTGITLSANVAGIMIHSTIPMVKLSEPPVIISVSSVVESPWSLYNDIQVRGECWLVAESLKTEAVAYQRLTIGPKGGITDQVIYADQKGNERSHKMIRHISEAIGKGASYPIVSEKCESCQFKRRCSI